MVNLCIGPERNGIQAVLNDVNWKALADQLNLQDQVASIQEICNREIDIRACYFREVVSRYVQSQPKESCDNTRRKIVIALEELGYVKEASRLMGGEISMYFADHILLACVLALDLATFPAKLAREYDKPWLL